MLNKLDLTGWSYVGTPNKAGTVTTLTLKDPHGFFWFERINNKSRPSNSKNDHPPTQLYRRFQISTTNPKKVDRYARKCIAICIKERARVAAIPREPIIKEF